MVHFRSVQLLLGGQRMQKTFSTGKDASSALWTGNQVKPVASGIAQFPVNDGDAFFATHAAFASVQGVWSGAQCVFVNRAALRNQFLWTTRTRTSVEAVQLRGAKQLGLKQSNKTQKSFFWQFRFDCVKSCGDKNVYWLFGQGWAQNMFFFLDGINDAVHKFATFPKGGHCIDCGFPGCITESTLRNKKEQIDLTGKKKRPIQFFCVVNNFVPIGTKRRLS